MSFPARITTISEVEWEKLHSGIEELTVTKLIQYIGWGYNSRNQLFTNKKAPKSKYLELALEHGKKYEKRAISKFFNPTSIIEKSNYTVCIQETSNNGRELYGSVDCYLRGDDSNLIIVEIKCPYGKNYGRFDEEDIEIRFEKNKRNWKHWLQLQIYMKMHQCWGVKKGLLCYYYKKGTGSNNGEEMLIVNEIKYDKAFWEEMKIDEEIKNFYEKVNNGRVKKSKYLNEDVISRGIIQRRKLLI